MTAASTTRAAHAAIGPLAASLQAQILDELRAAGRDGLIGDEVRDRLLSKGMKDGSLNTRYSELERAGLIFRNGEVRTARSGRKQLVMRLIEYADEVPLIAGASRRRRNPFLSGLMHAARIVASSPDMAMARQRLRDELVKVARRSST